MTEPFDWADLSHKAGSIRFMYGNPAAAAYLRTRIEAAFVPVERLAEVEAQREGCIIMAEGFKARAEAAEVRVKALEEDLRWVLDHDPKKPGLRFDSYELLLESLMSKPRAALGGEHDK